jgi:tetratricopeptide (TPR) repeat protein
MLDKALSLAPDVAGAARCKALRCASHYGDGVERVRMGPRADERSAEALALAQTLGDTEELADCQRQHAITLVRKAAYTGDASGLDEASALLAQSEAIFASRGYVWGQAIAVVVDIFVALGAGDLARVVQLCDRAWPLAVASGERFVVERVLFIRALTAELHGDVDRAIELHEQALAVSQELGFPEGIAVHSGQLEVLAARSRDVVSGTTPGSPDESYVLGTARVAAARAALAAGDVEQAEVLFREAMDVYEAAGMRGSRAAIIATIESLAQLRG